MSDLLDYDDPLSVPRPTEPGWVLLVFYDHETRGQGVLPVRTRELDRRLVASAEEALADAILARAAKQAGIDEWWKLTPKEAAKVLAKAKADA